MLNGKSLLFLILLTGGFACQKKEVPPQKVSILEWEPAPKHQFEPRLNQPRTQFIVAPKLSGHTDVVSGFEKVENLSENIKLKIERAWTEGDKRNVIVILENTSSKGTRANFYVFSHDERGLLIDAEQEEIFFNPHDSVFRRFEFSDASAAKSWSMSIK